MKKWGALLFIIVNFSLSTAQAKYFQNLRNDQNIPYHCSIPEVNNFTTNFETATFSIDHALEHGFTDEFPISRQGASLLWKFFKKVGVGQNPSPAIADQINKNPRLSVYKELILKNFETMGFDFQSEGEILEILVLLDLHKSYSPSEYYFTGGIEYFKGNGPTIGELDIVVGKKSDCKVVLIGEAKLGLHRLSKAKQQIQRFVRFVDTLAPSQP
ncbi:MAG: hypothetical protein KDD50_02170 [Bdellovibrionales bacterium]|nr:hypothetical protein [Bdellovibrionales bacterium]